MFDSKPLNFLYVPQRPLVYEINTRCWLRELSDQFRRPITLANVPSDYFAHWTSLGITHLWPMGVWQTAPASIMFSRADSTLRRQWSRLLPGFADEDISGSPYAISGYQVCESMGGEAGLAKFREDLRSCGIKLILDFIPNHTGLDYSRLRSRPDRYVRYGEQRENTFRCGTDWIAHGKDPYFPAWADTAQLDLRNRRTRQDLIRDLLWVSNRCDGVRCDMAMLVLREIFERNWPPPSEARWEFWPEAIAAVKTKDREFLFLAEAYWDLEQRLLDCGFDYVYDKRVYDLLIARKPGELQELLCSRPPKFLHRACHFLENHDEPRIASLLAPVEHRAAAMFMFALPGMFLLHEGQLTGATIRASVHLNRRPPQPANAGIARFYRAIKDSLHEVNLSGGQLLKPFSAWTSNSTFQNTIVIQGEPDSKNGFDLFAINLAPHPSQCRVRPVMISNPSWFIRNLLGTETYTRSGSEIAESGLYLELQAHTAQAFRFTPLKSGGRRSGHS